MSQYENSRPGRAHGALKRRNLRAFARVTRHHVEPTSDKASCMMGRGGSGCQACPQGNGIPIAKGPVKFKSGLMVHASLTLGLSTSTYNCKHLLSTSSSGAGTFLAIASCELQLIEVGRCT